MQIGREGKEDLKKVSKAEKMIIRLSYERGRGEDRLRSVEERKSFKESNGKGNGIEVKGQGK